MKLEELFLSREQMAHLRELGLDTTDALYYWTKNKKGEDTIKLKIDPKKNEGDDTYSVSELISILRTEYPYNLNYHYDFYPLRIHWCDAAITYETPNFTLSTNTYPSLLSSTYMAVINTLEKRVLYLNSKPLDHFHFLSDKQMWKLKSLGMDISDAAFCTAVRDRKYTVLPVKDIEESERKRIRYTYMPDEIYKKLFDLAKELDFVENNFMFGFKDMRYVVRYSDFREEGEGSERYIMDKVSHLRATYKTLCEILLSKEDMWESKNIEKEQLISDLISTLNGSVEDWSEVEEIMKAIKATGDKGLIEKAERIRRVI